LKQSISKKLSANDLGITGSHQSGILVPKTSELQQFFPQLDSTLKNPRVTLTLKEKDESLIWNFNYIHYNNKFFGGTRNEYRLTCMTKFLRAVAAKVDDDLIFEKDGNGSLFISCGRGGNSLSELNNDGVLVLTNGWKVINS
jgi:hypothetical protein